MRNVFHSFLGVLDPAPVRTWSLILSFYGDSILPRGGEVWLGTVSTVLAAVDIKPNSVRAAMRRLEHDGYLECRRTGRTSHYGLSARAVSISQEAERLIYRRTPPVAGEGWDIIVTTAGGRARRTLEAEGFRPLVPGMHMRPAGQAVSVPPRAQHLFARGNDAALAAALFRLDEIAARYRAFIDAVPLIGAVKAATPLDALILRLALVHAFRRVVLRDPHLAPAALPRDWPAAAAHGAFASTYAALCPAADAWLEHNARAAAGPLPPPQHAHRFRDKAGSIADV
ncbi:MAG: PaaX family transcriptional regulator C-terminal domain-containing protein [Pseudomonadota bacterium]